MDKELLRIKLRKLYHAYNHTPEDSPIYTKLEWEVFHLENIINGAIYCGYHSSEGCDKCRYYEECDLRAD